MSDELKTRLLTVIVTALVSGFLSFIGMEKSESDSSSKTNGRSWIAQDFHNHTEREDGLQRQIDDLRQQLNQSRK
jgi:hypothetical protein